MNPLWLSLKRCRDYGSFLHQRCYYPASVRDPECYNAAIKSHLLSLNNNTIQKRHYISVVILLSLCPSLFTRQNVSHCYFFSFSQREAKVNIILSFSSFSRVCVAQVVVRSLGGAALALSAILHGSCMNTRQIPAAKHASLIKPILPIISYREISICCL